MAQLRHLSALTVEATFEVDVPDVAKVPGVSMIEVQDERCAAKFEDRSNRCSRCSRTPACKNS